MQSSERQKEIILVAFDLISKHGIQELTIKKIALAVGISEAAIYRHFGSKVDILSSVIDEMLSLRETAFKQARLNSGTAYEMIRSFFLVQASLFEENPSLSIMLLSEDIFRNDASLLSRARTMLSDTLTRFKGLLEKGIAEGSIQANINCKAVALMLVGGFRLLVSTWRLEATSGSLQTGTTRLLEGILPLISVHTDTAT
ncbi:TetR/AcrR family transcriptional regulator [Spirochaetota bacterium]